MIEINKLLKKEADALVAFSQKPTAANAESFETVRRDVWPRIAKLLGINPRRTARGHETRSKVTASGRRTIRQQRL